MSRQCLALSHRYPSISRRGRVSSRLGCVPTDRWRLPRRRGAIVRDLGRRISEPFRFLSEHGIVVRSVLVVPECLRALGEAHLDASPASGASYRANRSRISGERALP